MGISHGSVRALLCALSLSELGVQQMCLDRRPGLEKKALELAPDFDGNAIQLSRSMPGILEYSRTFGEC